MAVTDTHVIGDYPIAVSIDGSTHYSLIQPGGPATAYNRINRNVYLGVTGQPADISTAQSITNKTLNNSNTITARDDRFTLQDNLDTTKQAQFQLSGITTATTRTYTLPNASSTLVDLSTVQTLTNKTLTSPVITGGSITGSTITTDAIIGQTSSTSGTVYGLSITSSKVGTNGIVTASITDDAVTAAKLQYGIVRGRQGGTSGAASYATSGTTNTDTSAVAVYELIGSAIGTTGDVTITFSSVFSQVPLVYLSTGPTTSNALPVLATVTTTNFSFRSIDSGGVQRAETVFWRAVGQ